MRNRGLLQGLATGTNWVFRDESGHMEFAFSVVRQVRKEEPDLFNAEMEQQIYMMIEEAIECELQFSKDLLSGGVVGLSQEDVQFILNM